MNQYIPDLNKNNDGTKRCYTGDKDFLKEKLYIRTTKLLNCSCDVPGGEELL